MRKLYIHTLTIFLLIFILPGFFNSCKQNNKATIKAEDVDEYDGPDEATAFEIERTKDPATGKVPWTKYLLALEQTKQAKQSAYNRFNTTAALSWTERGPERDINGPSGNSRPNGDVTAGRIRAAMIDSTDPTHKTVFVGGVDGGLWKTTNITVSPANWVLVNDFLSNLAVSAICQDPRPGFQNIMYFCTGEAYGNSDAVRGLGVFKSIDGGVSWNNISNTIGFTACTRILCDFQGNVYLATRSSGLQRSVNGGTSWTNITPSGISSSICDLEITSTAVAGRLHIVSGIRTVQAYRYTDNPATVTSGTGWNAPTTAFPSFTNRAEIAVNGNTLYAMPVDASDQVPAVYKSIDGGDNWIITGGAIPTTFTGAPFANGQGWYNLSMAINPSNNNECIIGGIDCAKTIDGGTTWTRISGWAGNSGQYVHADQHNIQWWDGGTKLLFACDGGVHYSDNGGTTIRDRNIGLRLKQFYSVAIHPTQTNYFLAGAQDNGVHQFTNDGLSSTTEVTGGDGCFVAIDQNEAQFQFGTSVYNRYRRSTNGGASWASINFLTGTSETNDNIGRFINPWDYDNTANILYAAVNAGNYFRIADPQTIAAGTYYQTTPGWPATAQVIPISQFSGGTVSAVHVSPYTPNRVFFCTGSGRIVKVDNADGLAPTDVLITPAGAAGFANCINTGSSDQNLIAAYSSYGVNNVWVSNNGGTSWTAIDGNLPDMPVRWVMFHPDVNDMAFIATETGVWETDLINGASTVWTPSPNFPTVRTDMIKYRASDRTVAAATHGRGLWTSTVATPSGFSFTSPAAASASCPAPSSMSVTLGIISNGGYSNPVTLSASAGVPAGTNITFSTSPLTPGNSSVVTLNNTNTLAAGTYVITITGTGAGTVIQTRNITFTILAGSGPVITAQPSNQTVCAGATTSFSITSATSTNFQWQVSTDEGVSYNSISNGSVYSGATSSMLTITGITAGSNNNRYRVLASAFCGTTTSTAGILTVNTVPVITAQPQNADVCLGANNTFVVTATGTALTYQWQISTSAAPVFTNISGAKAATYTVSGVTLAMSGNQYRLVINGTCAPSVISDAATLTVITAVTVITQPVNAEQCAGANVSFTVAGNSSQPIVYQWEVSTNGGVSYTAIAGATASTLNLNSIATSMNNNRYRAQLSNAICTVPSPSNAAILIVRTLPTIGLVASPLTSLQPGQSTTLIATPGASTGGTLATSWTYNGNPLSVINNLYVVTIDKAGSYRAMIQETWPGNLTCSNLSPVVLINAQASSKLFIFPSPNDGRFNVSYYNTGGNNTTGTVTVYDSRGARVAYKKFTLIGFYTLLAMDIRPAQKGIYYVVAGDANGKILADGKVLIQ